MTVTLSKEFDEEEFLIFRRDVETFENNLIYEIELFLRENNRLNPDKPIFSHNDGMKWAKQQFAFCVRVMTCRTFSDFSTFDWKVFKEAEQWCEEQFGSPGVMEIDWGMKGSYSGYCQYDATQSWLPNHLMGTFHFHDERHATLFKIAWGR